MWILIVLNEDDNDGSVIKIIGYYTKTSQCLCNEYESLFHTVAQRTVRYRFVFGSYIYCTG